MHACARVYGENCEYIDFLLFFFFLEEKRWRELKYISKRFFFFYREGAFNGLILYFSLLAGGTRSKLYFFTFRISPGI